MWISPSYQDTDFRHPLSADDKITVFADRIIGWKLDIADQVINGKKQADGSFERSPIPHSGYAALDIVFSYFEMVAKYEDGFAQVGRSNQYFKSGVYAAFPDLKQPPGSANVPGVQGKTVSIVEYALNVMYEGIRCGLYHSGITNGKVVLTGSIQQPMALDPQNMVLIINPHLLVPALKVHFLSYIHRLKDPQNKDLRQKFEARFDFDS